MLSTGAKIIFSIHSFQSKDLYICSVTWLHAIVRMNVGMQTCQTDSWHRASWKAESIEKSPELKKKVNQEILHLRLNKIGSPVCSLRLKTSSKLTKGKVNEGSVSSYISTSVSY